MSPKGRFVDMGGKRTESHFRRLDAIRAVEAARDAGISPTALEVVLDRDGGVTFRVLSAAAATDTTEGAKVWNAEIEKLKATPKGKGQL